MRRPILASFGLTLIGLAACAVPGADVEPKESDAVAEVTSAVTGSEAGLTYGPRGIFVLAAQDTISTLNYGSILNKSYVDGIAIRVGWEQLSTGDGLMPTGTGSVWKDKIEAALTLAQTYGKKVTLILMADKAPSWVVTAVGSGETYTTSFSGGDPVTTVKPWSEPALGHYWNFIWLLANTAVGTTGYSLRNHPALANVDAPIMGHQSFRKNSTVSSASGFTTGNFINGALSSINAVINVNTFPNQNHYFGYFGWSTDGSINVTQFNNDMMYALKSSYGSASTLQLPYRNSLALFSENLSCKTSSTVGIIPDTSSGSTSFDENMDLASGFQMLTSYNPNHLPTSSSLYADYQSKVEKCNGNGTSDWSGTDGQGGPGYAAYQAYNLFGSKYFEVYKQDFGAGMHAQYATQLTTTRNAAMAAGASGRYTLKRYYNSTVSDYWATTAGVASGWTSAVTLGKLLTKAQTGAHPVYECKSGTNDRFLSTSATCEGATQMGVSGYMWDSSATGRSVITRCYKLSVDHTAVTGTSCPAGYSSEGALGYAEN